MDKLKSLMIFMRSTQHGSFSEAARQLGMAPSAVSRAVLRLEDELGVRLLQRTTRSLRLTEDGNRFYQRCQQILNELEEAELEVKQSQSMPILQSYKTQVGLPIAVLYPQKRYLSAKVRVFVEFMGELTAALKLVDVVD